MNLEALPVDGPEGPAATCAARHEGSDAGRDDGRRPGRRLADGRSGLLTGDDPEADQGGRSEGRRGRFDEAIPLGVRSVPAGDRTARRTDTKKDSAKGRTPGRPLRSAAPTRRRMAIGGPVERECGEDVRTEVLQLRVGATPSIGNSGSQASPKGLWRKRDA